MVALNHLVYNFHSQHGTLRALPAMTATVTDQLREMSDVVALLEAEEGKKAA